MRQSTVLIQTLLIFFLFSACSEPPEVQVVYASRKFIEATVANVNAGTVRAEHSAELAFGAVGRVKVVNVKLGDEVKKGQVLAEVENMDLRTVLSRAELEYSRRAKLPKGAVSQSDLSAARQAVEEANMILEKTMIRAPYDGIVAEMNLEEGQLSQITAINPRAPIRIVDQQPRYVRAEIDEIDLPKVAPGLPARVSILAVRREPFPAKVRKVVPYVSTIREQERTAEVELDIEFSGGVLPAGASADVEIVVSTRNDALALPSRAVLGRGGERYVYRLVDDVIHRRDIEVGLFGYELTEIKSGLQDGDAVVIPSDIAVLKDGVRVKLNNE